jgi:hypothetical protein
LVVALAAVCLFRLFGHRQRLLSHETNSLARYLLSLQVSGLREMEGFGLSRRIAFSRGCFERVSTAMESLVDGVSGLRSCHGFPALWSPLSSFVMVSLSMESRFRALSDALYTVAVAQLRSLCLHTTIPAFPPSILLRGPTMIHSSYKSAARMWVLQDVRRVSDASRRTDELVLRENDVSATYFLCVSNVFCVLRTCRSF